MDTILSIALRRSCQIVTIPIRRSQKTTTTSETRFRKWCGTPIRTIRNTDPIACQQDIKSKADDLFQFKNNSTEIQISLLYDDTAGKHNPRMVYDTMSKTVAIKIKHRKGKETFLTIRYRLLKSTCTPQQTLNLTKQITCNFEARNPRGWHKNE